MKGDSPTVLEVRGITKTFPGVRALDDVSFACRRGEVHALVGENGAGKSTLMKILAGVYQPDLGQIIWNGSPVRFADPRDAQRHGISVIYQELYLLPYLSLAENITLGREPLGRWRFINRRASEAEAWALMAQLGAEVDVRMAVYRLSVAQQQLGEIAKALSVAASLIIMDEPTASLAGGEIRKLSEIIATLKARGVTVLYVSHRVEEIFRIADRVTVLKDGRWQGTLEVANTDRADLIRRMVGRQLGEMYPPRTNSPGEVVLEVRDLTRPPRLNGISFQVRAGEILGIAGLVGSGRTELARAVFGAEPPEWGEILIRGRRTIIKSPKRAFKSGIGFVTEDRKTEGLVLGLSVGENVALPSLDHRQWLGFVRGRQEQALVREYINQLEIRTPTAEREVRFLSGGNQQKVVLAKWLACNPDVLIFDEPTRGIDVGTKAEIYQLIRELTRRGKAVVMISSELPEVLGMSDRILVMRDGQVSGVLEAGAATEEAILTLATSGQDRGAGMYSARADPSSPVSEASATTRPVPKARIDFARLRESWNVVALYGALAVLLLGSFAVSESFRSTYNLINVLRQGTALGLVSIGQTVVMLAGGIDLSVSAMITLAAILSADLMQGSTALMAPVILLCLGLGVAAGLVNGSLVVFLRLQPFIATLGTRSVGQGAALIYTRGPVGTVSPAYRWLADGYLGPVPVPVVLLALTLAAGILFLGRVRAGRYLYAVGGNSQLAHLSGIPVRQVQFLAYALCGGLASVTGLYLSSRMGSGDPTVGRGFELDSITAVIVGGTVLGGGRGGVAGTMAGVFLVAVLNNVLNLLDVASWYQQIIKGLILLAAVAGYGQRR